MSMPFEKLVGKKVSHKILGRGLIVSCHERYISVKFDNQGKGGKLYKFLFPDIMVGEKCLMTTDSIEINTFLSQYRINHICSNCGKYMERSSSPVSQQLCNDCVSKMVQCTECKKFFYKQEVKKDYYGEIICKDCISKTRFYCTSCGELRPLSELIKSPYISKKINMCEECLEDMGYILCSCCGVYAPENVVEEVDGYFLCPQCKREKSGKCQVCGEQTVLPNKDTLIICSECKKLILHQKFIDSLDFSALQIETIPFYVLKVSKTRNIMSRLRRSYGEKPEDKSKEPIDILLIETSYGILVTCYNAPQNSKSLPYYGCTLTELKRKGVIHLFCGNTCIVKREIFIPSMSKVFYVWERPYRLNAQTISDMDYGDYWEGKDLVHEGNKYGDTSLFLILGFIK